MSTRGRPIIPKNKQAKPNDRIICKICKGEFTRANRSKHNNTKVHKLMEKMNEDVRKILENDDQKQNRGEKISVTEFKKLNAIGRIKKKIDDMSEDYEISDNECDDNSESEDENILDDERYTLGQIIDYIQKISSKRKTYY
jgi:hypothetical protein